jgi:ATP-dependent helicase/nuclease subunit A
MSAPLTDAEARRRIHVNTGETLFVEAGAGSGKTSSLVGRITELVLHDGVALRGIAAVTFTEKAGAELRDRIRAALERAGGEAAEQALDDLDGAVIGTLHSFAQRILAEHPIEAGLPPLVEVADELSSAVALDVRWGEQQRRLLDDDALAGTLELAMAAGVTLDHLRSLTRLFGADWDLLTERVLVGAEPAPPQLTGVAELADTAAGLAARAADCSDPADKLLPDLELLGGWAALLSAATDPTEQLEVLRSADSLKVRFGKAGSWGGTDALEELKQGCKELKAQAAAAVAAVAESTLRVLSRWVARRVLEAAEARRTAGRLEFHDLLVLARDVLRRDAGVRAALHDRYPVLLLDEFQDTDPIQIELAVRIAGGGAASQPRWEDVAVPEGALFVVGDPKQSIYRFRRADIALYLRSQKVIGSPVTLSTNFRSTAPVVSWVNSVFAKLITSEDDAQPHFHPLTALRGAPPTGPGVVALGAAGHPGKPAAAELRAHEAADVAATVTRALAEKWPVRDGDGWHPARLEDIVVLVPARTSLPYLEGALQDAGIAYRAEASSLVYEAQEVRDLLAAARAVADPSDRLALVTALRSALYGCGDDDLWTWTRDGGALNLLAPP